MYQARPPVSVVPAVPIRARMWHGSAGGAGRDTSWSNVTRAVGVYQARPLSVVSVTAQGGVRPGQWPGSESSHEITYLATLLGVDPVLTCAWIT